MCQVLHLYTKKILNCFLVFKKEINYLKILNVVLFVLVTHLVVRMKPGTEWCLGRRPLLDRLISRTLQDVWPFFCLKILPVPHTVWTGKHRFSKLFRFREVIRLPSSKIAYPRSQQLHRHAIFSLYTEVFIFLNFSNWVC